MGDFHNSSASAPKLKYNYETPSKALSKILLRISMSSKISKTHNLLPNLQTPIYFSYSTQNERRGFGEFEKLDG